MTEKCSFLEGKLDSKETFLFTSESVGEGHPDKMCDQIADAILDAHLQGDPEAKVACEVVAKMGLIMIFGEISSRAVDIDYQGIAREVVKDIGYDDSNKGLDYKTCAIMTCLDCERGNISSVVMKAIPDELFLAGDQGMMFGYATDETEEAMPLTIILAHKINRKVAQLRKNKGLWWARPDTKSQITCRYQFKNGACIPLQVTCVVLSVQHHPDVSHEQIVSDLKSKVIFEVIPSRFLSKDTIYHINPCGKFVDGGPMVDAGLTGRKIIVDTYGGWGAHGGGSFSGKDFTKVDRSGAYITRQIAKSLVKSGICKRCLVQVSYSIGILEPLSLTIFDYGTSSKTQEELRQIVLSRFDFQPAQIARNLELKKPIFKKTATYGHFGRNIFSWEKVIDLSEFV